MFHNARSALQWCSMGMFYFQVRYTMSLRLWQLEVIILPCVYHCNFWKHQNPVGPWF